MDRARVSAIAHATHEYCNPISAAKVESFFPLLALDAANEPDVIDFGCGKAALILRLAESFSNVRADGVDPSPFMLAEARERAQRRGLAERVQLHQSTAHAFLAGNPERRYRLAVSLGATHAFGTYDEMLAALRDATAPGGRVLVGEGYWRREPDPEYLEAFGGSKNEFGSHADNVARGERAGLIPLHALTATDDEWDEYEWRYTRTFEQWAREHPNEPGVSEALERMRAWRRTYLTWGRSTLGFGVYLFERP